MKKFILVFLLLVPSLVHAQQQRQSNITGMRVLGQAVAAEFGRWSASVDVGFASVGVHTIVLDTSAFTVPDGMNFMPITTDIPILIDDFAVSETVTPSAVSCAYGSGLCSFTATFTFAHPNRFGIKSGTNGLQEAVDWMATGGGRGGMVVVTPDWFGTTAMLTGAHGFVNVSVWDTRSGSINFYTWDGSHYVIAWGVNVTGGLVPTTIAQVSVINNVRYCNQFIGSTAGAKIAACIADLPATGGTADARGLEGAQTITQNILSGVTKPVALLLGAASYSISGASWTPSSNLSIIGLGSGITGLTWTGSGVWFDHNTNASALNNVNLSGFTLVVGGSSAGAVRVGDRTSAYNSLNVNWVVNDVVVTGTLGNGVGWDMTDFYNASFTAVRSNQLQTGMKLTVFTQSTFTNTILNGSTAYGLWIDNTQTSAGSNSTDGVVFTGLIVEGLVDGSEGLHITNTAGLTVNGLFIEKVSGTPAVGINLHNVIQSEFANISISGLTSNIIIAVDAYSVVFRDVRYVDVSQAVTASVMYNAPVVNNSQKGLGGVFFVNCGYRVNEAVRGSRGVSIFGDDLNPGSLTLTDVTGLGGLWMHQFANHQGFAHISETNLILDAFHGQLAYDTANTTQVVADAAASRGYAIKVLAGTGYGFQIPYPSQFQPGTYEFIIRGRRDTAGAQTGNIDSVGVGNITFSPFTAWTATYQIYSMRFTVTAAEIGAGTALRYYVTTSDVSYIDYMVLRPSSNDVLCTQYEAPFNQVSGGDPGGLNARISCSATVPSSGQYETGDFVYSLAPAGDHATVPNGSGVVNTLGWLRQTTGSAHVVGTDWVPIQVPNLTLVGVASLDFAAWAGGDCQDLTMTVTNVTAASGFANTVVLGLPAALASVAGVQFTGFVSGADTVTVRGCKITAGASANPVASIVVAKVERF